jgi:hypothetical protein
MSHGSARDTQIMGGPAVLALHRAAYTRHYTVVYSSRTSQVWSTDTRYVARAPRSFFLAIEYSFHHNVHFVINLAALLLCVIPKIPGVEGTRLFGLNRF